MLINRKGLVFVAQRLDQNQTAWQMPQGGIDKGEMPEQAAIRELKEETSVSNAEIVGESKKWYSYDLPNYLQGKIWKGKYRGQKQKWFAMRFTGNNNEIDISGVNNPEFSKWRWVDINNLPLLAVNFKKKIYKTVSDEFFHIVVSIQNN